MLLPWPPSQTLTILSKLPNNCQARLWNLILSSFYFLFLVTVELEMGENPLTFLNFSKVLFNNLYWLPRVQLLRSLVFQDTERMYMEGMLLPSLTMKSTWKLKIKSNLEVYSR